MKAQASPKAALSLCLCAAAALIAGQLTQADAAANPPKAGTYAANILVQSADGSLGCLDSSGERYAGEVSYGGLSATTLVIRVPLTGEDAMFVWQQTLTIKGGVGSLDPTGTFVFKGVGNLNWNVKGTFSATVLEIGPHELGMQISETYPDCAEKLTISLVRIGAIQ
jgi:hypothetical protein